RRSLPPDYSLYLHDARPGLLGEEFGGDTEAGAGLRFLVDPIDGTRAFMRGLPTWSVLVGVEYDGRPIAGVAFLPAAGDLYTAVLESEEHTSELQSRENLVCR